MRLDENCGSSVVVVHVVVAVEVKGTYSIPAIFKLKAILRQSYSLFLKVKVSLYKFILKIQNAILSHNRMQASYRTF